MTPRVGAAAGFGASPQGPSAEDGGEFGARAQSKRTEAGGLARGFGAVPPFARRKAKDGAPIGLWRGGRDLTGMLL